MIKKISFFALIIMIFLETSAQVVINELSPSNNSVRVDEDGDYPDWIELYNTGSSVVYLGGYKLSDNSSQPDKWIFPSGISLQPHGFLTVFASDKNRKAFFNHWETVVYANDNWRYIKPLSEPDSNWRKLPSFNDGAWSQGPGGIGYGDGDDNTLITAPATSVYMRRVFTIADTSVIASAVLHMDYDDAFVAYINGVEIARANIGVNGTPVGFSVTAFAEHEARMYAGGKPEAFVISESVLKSFLVNGNNVLAIQVHNLSPLSSDMSALPWLSAGIKNTSANYGAVPSWFNLSASALHTNFKLSQNGETLILSNPAGSVISQVTFGLVLSDHSYGFQPDGTTQPKYFKTPTPDASNNLVTAYVGYTSEPQFSLQGGFYPGTQSLALYTSTPGGIIHFTADGSIPEISSPVYTMPVQIDSTVVIRARTFHPGLLEGNTLSNSYFIKDSSSARLPVISLTVPPSLMFDPNTGIYVKGPNADASAPFFGANFWQEKEIPAHIEYFDTLRHLGFKQNIGIEIYGNYSRSYPQKSLKIIARESYGNGSFDYHLFPDKDIHSFKQFIIRNSGTDWNQTHMRDALIQSLSLKPTDCDVMAYQPAVVYINGKYWGVYNMREKINKDYLAENHNVDPDSVDLLEYNGFVMSGSNDAFLQMGMYVLLHDMSIPSNFEFADSLIDLKNFADYFAVETWTDNWDWLTNNVRYWRENKAGKKWRYILWDLDNGMGGPWSYVFNSLDTNLHKTTDYTSILFSRLLANQAYRNYFINRYADLINTLFTPQHFNATLNKFRNRLDHEMVRHFKRWGSGFSNPDWGINGHGSYDNWKNYQLPELTAFCNNRQITARNHIQETFGLKKQVPVTLNVYPPQAGKILINTISLEDMPWSGIYFDSVPVTITVIPNPGYHFSFWQSVIKFPAPQYDSTLTFVPDTSDVITAYFMGQADTAKITFSEINYNSWQGMNSGDWIELHNYSNWPMDISGWKFKDSQDNNIFLLPENTIIPPDEYLVLCQDTTEFRSVYPGINNILGSFDFGLNSAAESLRLFDRDMNIYLSMTFSGNSPWPAGANGTGRTLELLSVSVNIDNPLNWFAGCPGGSPCGPFIPCDNSGEDTINGNSDGIIAVYPNPVTESLIININPGSLAKADFSFTLYDMMGKTVYKINDIPSDEFTVLNNYLPGIYFYRIFSSDGYLKSGKLVFR
ncbi:MAG TPA: CotH kinase family protein [Bacteroidales bacterium]|nr:CotH kinase family protein [Bacteroidales bacterium]